MDEPVTTLTPELAPCVRLVPVLMQLPGTPDAPEYPQSFEVAAADVLHRLDRAGVPVERVTRRLCLWIAITGAPDGEAAEDEARRMVEAASGGWLVVER